MMQRWIYAVLIFCIVGCASKKINYDTVAPIENKEFDKDVKIKVRDEVPELKQDELVQPVIDAKTIAAAIAPKKLPAKTPAKILPKKPALEDAVGFSGRRPIVDPFTVGEKVVLDMKYMNARAGEMTIETLPYATVNGKKTYHFRIILKSTPTFDYFYSVDDMAETFVGFDDLVPLTHTVRIKESKQYGEIRSYFDWSKNIGKRWESKYVVGKGQKDLKKEWAVEPFAQNVISAIFYLRTFTLTPGKTIAYRVADSGDNFVFKGNILRKEALETKLGTINTVVVQPIVELKGNFKPMGDIFIWLTDDDRKQIVQIQAKIKIGSVFAKIASIQQPNP